MISGKRITPYNLYSVYANAKNKHSGQFMRAGSQKTFNDRSDTNIFSILIEKFCSNEILTRDDVSLFMIVNAKRLQSEFYPRNLLSPESFDSFRKAKKKMGSKQLYLDYVFSSFKFINDYCEDNKISVTSYFKSGKIPVIAKHYKQEKVPEDILVYSNTINLSKVRSNPLLSIYLKDLSKKYTMVQDRIKNFEDLRMVLANGFDYLRKEQDRRDNRNKK